MTEAQDGCLQQPLVTGVPEHSRDNLESRL
uniref:Uncharacterized protein n=1 Tax=Anguilla anguilla TaxID=7936 RepID=A0A0E9RAX6_ANGAN